MEEKGQLLSTLSEALRKKEDLVQAILEKKSMLAKASGLIRKHLKESGALLRADGRDGPGYAAVDSSFGTIIYGPLVEYVVVAVAVSDEGAEEGVLVGTDDGTDALAHVGIEEEYHSRAIEGMGMSAELVLAEGYRSKVPLVYLDGSFSTFIIKLNSMLTLSAEGGAARFTQELRRMGERAVRAFHRLLSEGTVVACPKMSTRNEFSEAFGDLLARHGLPQNDYLILEEVLGEGEYVEVPIRKARYALRYGDEILIRELFHLINSARVVYMKGASGKVYKFEVLGEFDPGWAYPFTVGKELLPIQEADRTAKEYLSLIVDEAYPGILEFYREGLPHAAGGLE